MELFWIPRISLPTQSTTAIHDADRATRKFGVNSENGNILIAYKIIILKVFQIQITITPSDFSILLIYRPQEDERLSWPS